METVEDEDGISRTVTDKPIKMRAHRWSSLRKNKEEDLLTYIDSEKHFFF